VCGNVTAMDVRNKWEVESKGKLFQCHCRISSSKTTTGAHLPSLNPKKPNVTKTLNPGQITKALLIQKIPPRMGMLRTIGAQLPSINPKKKNVTKTLEPGLITKALSIQKIPPRMGILGRTRDLAFYTTLDSSFSKEFDHNCTQSQEKTEGNGVQR